MSSENILWLNLHRLKWKGGYVAVKSPNLRMFNLLNVYIYESESCLFVSCFVVF